MSSSKEAARKMTVDAKLETDKAGESASARKLQVHF
jgi:hypothetical protein